MFMRLDENDNRYGQANLDSVVFDEYDAVVVSDYNKGFLSEEDLMNISILHPVTFLDTKKIIGEWSKNYTFIKINNKEYNASKHNIDESFLSSLIVTQGPKGCLYNGKQYNVPLVEVKDTSGAGDTFISALCYKYCLTKDIEQSIVFANSCSTSVVQKMGVATL